MGDTGGTNSGCVFLIPLVMMAPKGAGFCSVLRIANLLGGGRSSGEGQLDGGLDFPGGDGGPLVVVSQTGSFSGDSFEDIVDTL